MHGAFLVPPAPGHLNPTLGLVAELLRRGHRVSYATGPGMEAVVRDLGADLIELSRRVSREIRKI